MLFAGEFAKDLFRNLVKYEDVHEDIQNKEINNRAIALAEPWALTVVVMEKNYWEVREVVQDKEIVRIGEVAEVLTVVGFQSLQGLEGFTGKHG